jgi:hypothetical protein
LRERQNCGTVLGGEQPDSATLGPTRTEVIRATPDAKLSGLKVEGTVRAEFETATVFQITRNGAESK